MGYLEGLLGGFTGRKREVELMDREDQVRAQDRENRILDALVNSPDPEVRSHGIAAMLDSASPKPKMKGLRGFLGEVQGSPHLGTIQSIVEADRAAMAAPAGTGQISTPPTEASAAQVTTSPTVGGPPPTVEPSLARTQEGEPLPPAATGPPPTPEPAGAPPLAVLGKETPAPAATRQPRQIFQTPEGQMRLTKKAAAQGDVEGEIAGLVSGGFTESEARALVKSKMERLSRGVGGMAPKSIAGEIVDATGKTVPTFAIFDPGSQSYLDPATKQPLAGFRPKATGAGANPFYGQDREAIAKSVYGKSFKDLTQEESTDVIEKERGVIQGKAEARGTGAGVAAFNKPIGVGEAQRTNTTVGSSSANYAGQEIASTQEQDRRRGISNVQSELANIKTLLGVLPKAAEAGGLAPNATLAIRRRSPQYRAQAAQLDAAIDNILASLSRTIQENRGAQTEKDAERAYSTIASMKGSLLDPLGGDTQESAAARIAQTEQYLETILKTLPGTPVPQAVGAPPPAAAAPVTTPPAPVKPGAKPVGAKPGAGGSATPGAYQDAQGAWHIRSSRENQF